MVTLQDICANWKNKETLSIECNMLDVGRARYLSRSADHRGLENVWYGTWDITINKTIDCYRSISMIHQPRISQKIERDDGTERLKWRIPDFGIMRHAGKRKIMRDGRLVWKNATSRLVAIGEIKTPPIDNTGINVKEAVSEARADLLKQVRIFFGAHPQVKAIVGISVAGNWWTFETFTNTSFPSIADSEDEDPSYEPPTDEDELDCISEPEEDRDNRHFFKLQTLESDLALAVLVDAIKTLEGCEQFNDTRL